MFPGTGRLGEVPACHQGRIDVLILLCILKHCFQHRTQNENKDTKICVKCPVKVDGTSTKKERRKVGREEDI